MSDDGRFSGVDGLRQGEVGLEFRQLSVREYVGALHLRSLLVKSLPPASMHLRHDKLQLGSEGFASLMLPIETTMLFSM